MKKIGVIIISAVLMALLISCNEKGESADSLSVTDSVESDSVKNESAETEEKKETTEIANPWVEADREEVEAVSNTILNVPPRVADVQYSYNEDEKMGQVTFSVGGADWTYRSQPAGEFTDISGMNYNWDTVENSKVTGREAKYYIASNASLVNWYDKATGTMYSLSEVGGDFDGDYMVSAAEELFME